MIASYEYAACLTLPIHTIRQDVPPPNPTSVSAQRDQGVDS